MPSYPIDRPPLSYSAGNVAPPGSPNVRPGAHSTPTTPTRTSSSYGPSDSAGYTPQNAYPTYRQPAPTYQQAPPQLQESPVLGGAWHHQSAHRTPPQQTSPYSQHQYAAAGSHEGSSPAWGFTPSPLASGSAPRYEQQGSPTPPSRHQRSHGHQSRATRTSRSSYASEETRIGQASRPTSSWSGTTQTSAHHQALAAVPQQTGNPADIRRRAMASTFPHVPYGAPATHDEESD
jgi:hypothetical protein